MKRKAAKKPSTPAKKTTRIGKTGRVPKTRAGNMWTEAQFWGFIRSGLRGISRRWPPLCRLALAAAHRPYVGPNKLQKHEYQCAKCAKWFKRTQVQVDHILSCGQLKSWQDLATFAARLFCEVDGLRILCTVCHDARKLEVVEPVAPVAATRSRKCFTRLPPVEQE
jgi:hypothetical protein